MAVTKAILAIAGRRASPPRTVIPGQLHITAAVGTADISLRTEEKVVRAALLYADRVTLLSPAAYMLDAVDLMRSASVEDLVEIVQRVGPLLPGFDPRLLRLPRSALAAALREMAPGIRQEFVDIVEQITDIPSMRALDLAKRKGFLEVESLTPRHEDAEMLNQVRASLAANIWSDGRGVSNALDVLVSRLGMLLNRGVSLPLFDDIMGDFARQGVVEGLFVPSRSAGSRVAEAGLATGFLEHLPSFPHATIDEVFDIRAELNAPLTRFRAEVVRLSSTTAVDRDL